MWCFLPPAITYAMPPLFSFFVSLLVRVTANNSRCCCAALTGAVVLLLHSATIACGAYAYERANRGGNIPHFNFVKIKLNSKKIKGVYKEISLRLVFGGTANCTLSVIL